MDPGQFATARGATLLRAERLTAVSTSQQGKRPANRVLIIVLLLGFVLTLRSTGDATGRFGAGTVVAWHDGSATGQDRAFAPFASRKAWPRRHFIFGGGRSSSAKEILSKVVFF
jgi:hypothetical protein